MNAARVPSREYPAVAQPAPQRDGNKVAVERVKKRLEEIKQHLPSDSPVNLSRVGREILHYVSELGDAGVFVDEDGNALVQWVRASGTCSLEFNPEGELTDAYHVDRSFRTLRKLERKHGGLSRARVCEWLKSPVG